MVDSIADKNQKIKDAATDITALLRWSDVPDEIKAQIDSLVNKILIETKD